MPNHHFILGSVGPAIGPFSQEQHHGFCKAALPVGLYSSMYATCNARSLMNFLSLRTQHELATVPSFPQREIEMVAELMEQHFVEKMPLTHAAFEDGGRVAP